MACLSLRESLVPVRACGSILDMVQAGQMMTVSKPRAALRTLVVGSVVFIAWSCPAIAQDVTAIPAFEVASVRLAPAPGPTVNPGMHISSNAGRLDYLNIPLVTAIREAYGVTWQLENGTGPESIWSERYCIGSA